MEERMDDLAKLKNCGQTPAGVAWRAKDKYIIHLWQCSRIKLIIGRKGGEKEKKQWIGAGRRGIGW
jgi:hypothetical protein